MAAQTVHWDGRPSGPHSLPIGVNELFRPWVGGRGDGRRQATGSPTQPLVLPHGVDQSTFDRYIRSLAAIVGEDAVLVGHEHAELYSDPFAVSDNAYEHLSSAAVKPQTVDQVRALVRLAGEHDPPIPFWAVSRGRNLGYGGAAPVVSGSVVMDLSLMNKVLEVNEEYAYAIVEPGCTFFDLYDEIRRQKLKLLSTTPGIGWGSIVGNTLDRGWGYTPTGDHPNNTAGMEVVTADGDLLRTGMGAIEGSKSFALFKGSYGPAPDQMFMQSNLGVVTKLGIWLTPMPQAMYLVVVLVDKEKDLIPLVDKCGALKRQGVIHNNPVIGNIVRMATLDGSPRTRWWPGSEAIPDDVLEKIKDELDCGWWNAAFCMYGDPRILDIQLEKVDEAFRDVPGARVSPLKLVGKEADAGLLNPQALFDQFGIGIGINLGVPSLVAVDSCKWRGEDCGHLSFSPVLRPNGEEAYEFYLKAKKASAKYGFDYFAGLHLSGRHLTAIEMLLYDRHDKKQRDGAAALFEDLVLLAKEARVSEYRAHVAWMDKIAEQYNFNGGALLRFNNKVKAALDPKGILSPGKSGIYGVGARPKDGKRVQGVAKM